jgi:hypothetical protein
MNISRLYVLRTFWTGHISPSVNELVVRAVATETWKAHRSRNGVNGERNPLGKLMFGPVSDVSADVRPTRSAASGIVPIALRGEITLGRSYGTATSHCGTQRRCPR